MFHDARKPAAGLDLTELFISTKGTIWIVTKMRCSTFKQLRVKLILVIPVTLRLAPLLKTNVAVTQFLGVRTATMVVKGILNMGSGFVCTINLPESRFRYWLCLRSALGSSMNRPWAQSKHMVNQTRVGSKGFIIHQIPRPTESLISKFINSQRNSKSNTGRRLSRPQRASQR